MKRRRRGPSRWAKRRAGEITGYLARHTLATVEDIAEYYQRDPDQVRETLNDLEADGEVIGGITARPGMLGDHFIAVVWALTHKD